MARFITAEEILAERAAVKSGSSFSHGTGRSMFWISCGCPNCSNEYDPTGEETAKFMNMDPSSFFTDQAEMLSFDFSTLAKESFIYNAKPGFYIDSDTRVNELDSLLGQLMLSRRPSHILRIGKDRTWDRFFLVDTDWVRRTWKRGRSVFYKEGENSPIPFDTANEALCAALDALFSTV